MSKLPSFGSLWAGYPDGTGKEVRNTLGGACNNNSYENTCAMRMSMSLLEAGIHLHPGPKLYAVKGGNGQYKDRWIALRQKELSEYLRGLWGAPEVLKGTGEEYTPPEELKGRKGVVSFFEIPDYLGGSGGHIDVFDGKQCKYNPEFHAKRIWFWEASP
jgi:hypothetical protein